MAEPVGPNWDELLAGAGEPATAESSTYGTLGPGQYGPDWSSLLPETVPQAATAWGPGRAMATGATLGLIPMGPAGARELYNREHPLMGPGMELAGSVLPVGLANALIPELSIPMQAAGAGRVGIMAGRVATGALRGAEAGVMQTPLTGGGMTQNALTGAGIGSALPLAAGGVRAMLQPTVVPGVRAAAAAAGAAGLRLRPGQYAFSSWLTKADRALMSGRDEPQLRQATKLLAKSIGENSDSLTPALLESAAERIGKGLDTVAANTSLVYDQTLHSTLNNVMYKVTSASGISHADVKRVKSVIEDIRKSAAFTPAGKSGRAFQQLTQFGSMLGELSQVGNPTVRQAGGEISDALFETLARHSPADQVKTLFDLKDQYKNVLSLRKAAEKAGPSGLINPKDVSALATGEARLVRQVAKFLPTPTPSGESKALTSKGFIGSGLKIAAAVAAGQQAQEAAAYAIAHPAMTSAAVAAATAALGTKPLVRGALGSQWLSDLALGKPVVNSLVPRVILPVATGAANLQGQ